MERELEGYSRAVRTVMQESRRGKLRGIHGAVSMLLRTQDSYTVAIEVALGSAMQNIVVEDEGCAKAAIQYLKRSDNGRATFLPLSVIHGRPLNESGIERCAGFCGVASDLVSCEPRYREIILNLLGRTVVAQDLDAAISIANKFGHRFRIVTLDGQVLNAGGSMTGGSVSAVRASCRAPTRSSVCRPSRRRPPPRWTSSAESRRRRSACWSRQIMT